MKKTLLTLAGCAMLVSVLTLSASTVSLKDGGKSRAQKRALFGELSKKEKEEMSEMVAQDLGEILHQDKEIIKEKIRKGVDVKEIIAEFGVTVEEVLSIANERQRQAFVKELDEKVKRGVLSLETRNTFLKKGMQIV